jgi:hypothetical protein
MHNMYAVIYAPYTDETQAHHANIICMLLLYTTDTRQHDAYMHGCMLLVCTTADTLRPPASCIYVLLLLTAATRPRASCICMLLVCTDDTPRWHHAYTCCYYALPARDHIMHIYAWLHAVSMHCRHAATRASCIYTYDVRCYYALPARDRITHMHADIMH